MRNSGGGVVTRGARKSRISGARGARCGGGVCMESGLRGNRAWAARFPGTQVQRCDRNHLKKPWLNAPGTVRTLPQPVLVHDLTGSVLCAFYGNRVHPCWHCKDHVLILCGACVLCKGTGVQGIMGGSSFALPSRYGRKIIPGALLAGFSPAGASVPPPVLVRSTEQIPDKGNPDSSGLVDSPREPSPVHAGSVPVRVPFPSVVFLDGWKGYPLRLATGGVGGDCQ
jgi:hypothetical protein